METTLNKQGIDEWVVLAQIPVLANNPDVNVQNMIQVIENTQAWKLIIFPEMCVPGYMIGDAWLKDSALNDFLSYNDDILAALEQNQNSAIWGNIETDKDKRNEDGTTRKYNSAYIAENGKLLWVQRKTLLPNYRMFDDKRYFSSLSQLALEEERDISEYHKPVKMEILWTSRQVSTLICEDIWNINGDYHIDPMELVREYKPDLIAVLSTSPYGRDKSQFRDQLLADRSSDTTLAYVNPIGTQNIGKNIHAMDGGSSIYIDWKFIRGIADFTSDQVRESLKHPGEIAQAYNTIVYSLRDFWEKLWKPKVVIGLSGWIDSWVVASLLKEAIWSENIVAVNMPSKFNSKTTQELAKQTAENLWVEYKIFPIQEIVDHRVAQIEEVSWQKISSFELENIQARIRGQILSDLSARYWWFHTNNGNKDEIARGYATLYWDVSWAIAPIWDLHKYQVFELVNYINSLSNKPVIPKKMTEIKPSAELSEEQNPETGWGDPFDYDVVGKTIKALWEQKLTDTDILELYIEGQLEEKIWLNKKIDDVFDTPEMFLQDFEKLYLDIQGTYFKRVQAPPIITVNKASFWFDYRESQNTPTLSRSYLKLKQEFLSSWL